MTDDSKRSNAGLICLAGGILLAIVMEILITAHCALSGRWQESRQLDLKSCVEAAELELTDCILEDDSILSEKSYATMVFHGAESWGNIYITFSEPVLNAARVEWLDSPSGEAEFDRFRCIEGYLMPGTREAGIVLPMRDTGNFRIDIHGNFRIASIAVSQRLAAGTLTPDMILSHINWLRLIVFAFFGVSGLYLYQKERRQRKLKASVKREGRIVYLDAARSLAAALVIVGHVSEPLTLLYPMGSGRYTLLKMVTGIATSSSALFVMMSGALLLTWRDESWGVFFKKRFLKIMLPLAVYGMFYLKGSCISRTDLLSWIRYGLRTFITGNFATAGHLWLIYVLLGLYFGVIPLRYMLRDMKEETEKKLAALILALLSAVTLARYMGCEFGMSAFLGEWPGIFIMGYLINKPWMRRYDRALLAAGGASVLISIWVVMTRANSIEVIANQSVLCLLMAMAVYAAFLHLDHLLAPAAAVFAVISKYSYSVILVHVYILTRVVYNGWFNSGMNQYLQVIVTILWCGLLSTVTAWFVDHFVINVLMAAKAYTPYRINGLKP